MKVGITGANGFIAWHLRCFLYSLGDEVSEIRLADRKIFSDRGALLSFVGGLDLIVHLAGVNRATDDELSYGNIVPAKNLVKALSESGTTVTVVFSSTSHAIDPLNVYGKAKKNGV